jgi:hypothetical protein
MKMISKLTALAVLLSAASSMAVFLPSSYTFGSANDGLAGFTQSTVNTNGTETWTTSANSVQYRNQDGGTYNSSFLRSIPLDRTPDSGIQYKVSGTVTMTDLYADDNNRVGIYLFGDDIDLGDGATVGTNSYNGEDELGALGIIFNYDDSVTAGSPGNNARDNLNINMGIDAGGLTLVLRDQTTPFAQDLKGTDITISASFAFVGTDIIINASIMDLGGMATTTNITVDAALYTGDYFGFVSRGRARNFAGEPTDPFNRESAQVFDYKSFAVVPEPATVGLFGLGAIGAWIVRRNKQKALEQEEEI